MWVGLIRGAWTTVEDQILTDYIKIHGEGKWRNLPKRAGLKRCGKSCRLRWLNYLRPDIKRGNITPDEEDLIIRLHKLLGNRWSLIAGRLPGRTDNEIKNYCKTKLGKKVQGYPISTSNPSKEKQNTTNKQLPSPTPESCDNDVTSPDSEKALQRDTQPVAGPSTMKKKDIVDEIELGPEPPDGIPQFSSGLYNPSDFMMDFEMDEKFLSDLLNSDFGLLFENDDGEVKGDSNANTNGTSYFSSNSNQTHFFS
ncbi:hypothetical protein F0562_022792 [Nyssa sinensis]|uniref:Uncharacterized protein n=1 Tax=Nyssa sinensis TaxID=561372 RepID=A0A5J5BH99_9ASTE|nr:hypothetical protein F0562_022792 [Nyssa sinensis]